jgi:hypothetical protein
MSNGRRDVLEGKRIESKLARLHGGLRESGGDLLK